MKEEVKERFIEINGQMVQVSEEVYRTFKRPAWAERQRNRRKWRCKAEGKRCMKNCEECTRKADGAPLSLDEWYEDPKEFKQQEISSEEIFMRDLAVEALHQAISMLANNDQAILILYSEGFSDHKISDRIGMPQTTVSYRRKILIKALREQLKDYHEG